MERQQNEMPMIRVTQVVAKVDVRGSVVRCVRQVTSSFDKFRRASVGWTTQIRRQGGL